jgi:hypothetical protein
MVYNGWARRGLRRYRGKGEVPGAYEYTEYLSLQMHGGIMRPLAECEG